MCAHRIIECSTVSQSDWSSLFNNHEHYLTIYILLSQDYESTVTTVCFPTLIWKRAKRHLYNFSYNCDSCRHCVCLCLQVCIYYKYVYSLFILRLWHIHFYFILDGLQSQTIPHLWNKTVGIKSYLSNIYTNILQFFSIVYTHFLQVCLILSELYTQI